MISLAWSPHLCPALQLPNKKHPTLPGTKQLQLPQGVLGPEDLTGMAGLCVLVNFDSMLEAVSLTCFSFFFSSTSLLLPNSLLPPSSCMRAQSRNPLDYSPPGSTPAKDLFLAHQWFHLCLALSGSFYITTVTIHYRHTVS